MRTHFALLILFCIYGCNSYGQTLATEQKTINYSNGKEVFSVCKINPVFEIKDKTTYHWYSKDFGIKETKGGIGGQLLNGKYQVFRNNGDLWRDENYTLGIEDGTFREWDSLGNIIGCKKYKNGDIIYNKYVDSGYIVEWIGGFLFCKGCIKKTYANNNSLESVSKFIDIFQSYDKIYYPNSYGEKLHYEGIGILNGGRKQGLFKEYYENGKPKVIAHFYYKYELRDSIWTFFNERGEITERDTYRIHIEKNIAGVELVIGSEYRTPDTKEWLKDGEWIYKNENGDGDGYEKYEDGVLQSSHRGKEWWK